MAIQPLIFLPDPILKKVSHPIETFDHSLKRLSNDMLDTMYNAPGIGLAAIQIGIEKRICVIDISKDDEKKTPFIFINPKLIETSDQHSTYEEGCLSIPDFFAEVERPACVKVEYQDIEGKINTLQVDGMLATCLQHEMDHMDGILFIDHISKLKRDRVIKKFKKIDKQNTPTL